MESASADDDIRELDFECHPAKFSIGFNSNTPVSAEGELVFADPFDGCSELKNPDDELRHGVVVLRRGRCTFGNKAETIAQKLKSGVQLSAVLVIDNVKEEQNSVGSFFVCSFVTLHPPWISLCSI